MFRKSCVHHQEDHLHMPFLWHDFHAEQNTGENNPMYVGTIVVRQNKDPLY